MVTKKIPAGTKSTPAGSNTGRSKATAGVMKSTMTPRPKKSEPKKDEKGNGNGSK
jgi:hypothetical protein